jgi:hypothetical protein
MNIRTAISFPIQDPNWIRKFVVGSIIFMFSMPILTLGMPLLLGWTIQIGRKVWHGLESPLPRWKKAGEFFLEGLKLWIANLVWFIPTILGVAFVATKITYDLVSQCSGGGNECAFMTVLTTWFPVMITASILMISLWPLQLGVAIQTGSLAQMLNPIAAFRLLRKNFRGIFPAWIVGVLSVSFLALIGTIAFFLPWFVFNFDFQNVIVFGLAVSFIMVFVFLLVSLDIFGMAVSSHLFGQALASIKFTGRSIPTRGEEGHMCGRIGA